MPNCGLLYTQWVLVHCSVVGLWHATVAEYVCVHVFHSWSSAGAGISVGSTLAIQAFDVKCIESDNHSAVYTILVLDTINAVVILKQFYMCKN